MMSPSLPTATCTSPMAMGMTASWYSTKKGNFLRAWGKLGAESGQFSQPHSIALDSKGRVYVADRNNSRIQIFDGNGKFLTEWKNIITPWYIVITNNDEIYVCG